jgi:septal ring factor EnvC (AmiA/AmiB activator)
LQEVNNLIEESCLQTVNNLPRYVQSCFFPASILDADFNLNRVMRELEALKQEAALLQDQMKMIKFDIQKVEQDTAQSMMTLLRLDTVKTRMKDASEALQVRKLSLSLVLTLSNIFYLIGSGQLEQFAFWYR